MNMFLDSILLWPQDCSLQSCCGPRIAPFNPVVAPGLRGTPRGTPRGQQPKNGWCLLPGAPDTPARRVIRIMRSYGGGWALRVRHPAAPAWHRSRAKPLNPHPGREFELKDIIIQFLVYFHGTHHTPRTEVPEAEPAVCRKKTDMPRYKFHANVEASIPSAPGTQLMSHMLSPTTKQWPISPATGSIVRRSRF